MLGDGVDVYANASDDEYPEIVHEEDGNQGHSQGIQGSYQSEWRDETSGSSSSEEQTSEEETGSEDEWQTSHSRRRQECKTSRTDRRVLQPKSILQEEGEGELTEEEIQEMRWNPKVKKFLRAMFGEASEMQSGKIGKTQRKTRKSKTKNPDPVTNNVQVKSPSDTTIYAPGLRKQSQGEVLINRAGISSPLRNGQPVSVIDQVSKFVENLRVEVDKQTPPHSSRGEHLRERSHNEQSERCAAHSPARSNDVNPSKDRADHYLIEAEQFKASVAQPKGISGVFDHFAQEHELTKFIKLLLENDDDEFFHLTCHVDPGLKGKIEKGQYVDLARLLPRTRSQVMSDEQRMQFINKDGASFLVPAEKDNKISGIRRWDQAFRIYAAIYCKANPNDSAEIWQYIYVINTAASSYAWENIAYYDFTFRQLVGERPNRNWGKTYNQLWNLAMCEPLVKGQSGSGQISYNSGNNSSPQKNKSWRDRCCWRYNRGAACKKWTCNFDHRCSYCGSWNHAAHVCPKRKGSR